MMNRTRSAAVLVGAAAIALTATACSSSSSETSSSASPSASNSAASAVFGQGCAALPPDGPGSVKTIANEPVATAASGIPALSTLVTQVTAANLATTLNEADGITVFAPINSAFEKVPAATLNALTKDPSGALANVLKYHVVAGELSPEQLPGSHTTLEGQDLTITGSGQNFTINGTAKIVCGNVTTSNAKVYVIDGVLVPPAK